MVKFIFNISFGIKGVNIHFQLEGEGEGLKLKFIIIQFGEERVKLPLIFNGYINIH